MLPYPSRDECKDDSKQKKKKNPISLPTAAGRPEAYSTTIAFLKRRVTEAKWRDSLNWIKERVGKQRARTYILPRRQKPDPTPAHIRKGIAQRYYQLKTGHALIGTYLHWRTLRNDNLCWWCSAHTPQNLHHLFKRCDRWKEQQRTLWRDVLEATKEGRKITERTPMPRVFADWRCSQAIIDFLAHTEVGRSYPKLDAGDGETVSDSEEDEDSEAENLGEWNPGNTDVDAPEEETDGPMPAEESPCNTESSNNAEDDGPRLEGHIEESDGNTEEDSSVMGNAAGHRPS
jgi:hypothetical protein